jgi:hypothetical protein
MHALGLTLNWCFDFDCTEQADHHCPVCTMPTIDFLIPTEAGFVESKTNLEIPQPRRNKQKKLPPSFARFKNHPLK